MLRVIALPAIALVCGCGRIAFDPLGTGTGGDDMPGGDGGSSVDDDQDGAPDSGDNCVGVSNPGQENEDSDAFGDACDRCPAFFDDNVDGADNDGVTSLCDPHPTAGGDTIQLFEGFANGFPAGWAAVNGWTEGTGEVSVDVGANFGAAFTLPIVADTTSTIFVGFVPVQNNGAQGDFRAVGILPRQNGFLTGLACVVYLPTGTSVKTVGNINIMTDATLASMAYTWVEGNPYVLRAEQGGGQVKCDVYVGTTMMATATSSAIAVATPSTSFYTNSISTSVQWVMVVDSP